MIWSSPRLDHTETHRAPSLLTGLTQLDVFQFGATLVRGFRTRSWGSPFLSPQSTSLVTPCRRAFPVDAPAGKARQGFAVFCRRGKPPAGDASDEAGGAGAKAPGVSVGSAVLLASQGGRGPGPWEGRGRSPTPGSSRCLFPEVQHFTRLKTHRYFPARKNEGGLVLAAATPTRPLSSPLVEGYTPASLSAPGESLRLRGL